MQRFYNDGISSTTYIAVTFSMFNNDLNMKYYVGESEINDR